MSKSSERHFHLTISLLATTLALLSIFMIVYQREPAWIPSWLKQEPVVKQWVSRLSNKQATTGSTAERSSSKFNDLTAKPAYQFAASDSERVIVKSFGTDVGEDEVQNVRQLMNKYRLVKLVSNTLALNISTPVYIYIVKNETDYGDILRDLGTSSQDAHRLTLDTGGYTQDNRIIVPLYQNTSQGEMANTIAHELTHAFLNEYVDEIPSWINEGLAWNIGMAAQSHVDESVSYKGYARGLAVEVLTSEQKGQLLPLADDENVVLDNTSSYDVELQDWLAVGRLIEEKGQIAFSDYFYRLHQGEVAANAFERTFGVSEKQYNTSFTQLLDQIADSADHGVTLTFRLKSYHGKMSILQHGHQTWNDFLISPPGTRLTVLANGRLQGASEVVRNYDSTPPDDSTLYINLEPKSPFIVDGKPVDNCGIAIDYHYGMYSFLNTWITFKSGKTTYGSSPSLFGVDLTSVTEVGEQTALMQVIDAHVLGAQT